MRGSIFDFLTGYANVGNKVYCTFKKEKTENHTNFVILSFL